MEVIGASENPLDHRHPPSGLHCLQQSYFILISGACHFSMHSKAFLCPYWFNGTGISNDQRLVSNFSPVEPLLHPQGNIFSLGTSRTPHSKDRKQQFCDYIVRCNNKSRPSNFNPWFPGPGSLVMEEITPCMDC